MTSKNNVVFSGVRSCGGLHTQSTNDLTERDARDIISHLACVFGAGNLAVLFREELRSIGFKVDIGIEATAIASPVHRTGYARARSDR